MNARIDCSYAFVHTVYIYTNIYQLSHALMTSFTTMYIRLHPANVYFFRPTTDVYRYTFVHGKCIVSYEHWAHKNTCIMCKYFFSEGKYSFLTLHLNSIYFMHSHTSLLFPRISRIFSFKGWRKGSFYFLYTVVFCCSVDIEREMAIDFSFFLCVKM